MVGQQIRSREDWLQHVSSWRQSGLSQAEYGRRHALKKSSFNKWIHKQTQVPHPKGALDLPLQVIPITVKAAGPSKELILRSPHGWELKLPSGVSAQWVGSVLGALS